VLSSTLLDALTLSGTVVTIDAMGCQKSIAGKIVFKGADYIVAGRRQHI
jgi:predicted transposase YbfD/YdcC